MKIKFPTAYSILAILIIVLAVLTWIIPAGSYEYLADGEPIAGTYHAVAQNAQGVGAVFF